MRVSWATKKRSSKTQHPACASWWTIWMMVTFIKRLSNIRRPTVWLVSQLFGKFSSRWSRHSEHFTLGTFYTEIWKVLMYSYRKMETPSSVIWMSPRLLKRAFFTLRQVRLTMRVLKCGKISHTVPRVTSGHLVASCTRCVLWSHRSEPMTWMVFTSEFWRDSTHLSTGSIRKSLAKYWQPCSESILNSDQVAHKSSI